MKDIKEILAIMQDYANGKEIEVRAAGCTDEDGWDLEPNPYWDWFNFEYRVKPKTRLMTNRELAKWCATGNGEYTGETFENAYSKYAYKKGMENEKVDGDILIRSWDETEWHKPLIVVEE